MTRSPPVVGVALLFTAGIAASRGSVAGACAVVALAVLLRVRFPRGLSRRPASAALLSLGLFTAGLLHGGFGSGDAVPDTSSATAPSARPRASSGSELRHRMRARILEEIRTTFPTEAPLAEALLLAERSGLDPGLRRTFARSGAAHLLAISGFHVGVLAGWVLLLLRALGLGRGQASAVAAGAVWGYVALLGFPTSAVRAALILTAAAAGRIRGRPVHRLGSWALALLVLMAADPGSVGRAGAQLSFAGALGLMLWADPWGQGITGWVARRAGRASEDLPPWAVAVAAAVAASLSAQLVTLPLATWHFQRVAVTGLPATLAATPLVSLALPGTLLALAARALSLPGAGILASGAEGLLWATRSVLVFVARLDPGLLLGPAAVLFGTAAGVVAWHLTRRSRDAPLRAWATVAAVVAGVTWGPEIPVALRSGLEETGLEVRVLDVGQGDAIAVGTPAGRWILVDTGAGSGDRLVRSLTSQGIRRLELLVLTHPDLDHMGAAAGLVARFPVGAVADGGTVRGTDAFLRLADEMEHRGVPWRVLARGDTWTLDGVHFQVLHPGSDGPEGRDGPSAAHRAPNDRSVVLHVSWGDFDLLLTGDISVEVEARLAPLLRPVEVLKVAHHGSRTSTGSAFLDRTTPQGALISVGRRNRFGHPAPSVLRRLRDRGIPVFRTDRGGTLQVRAYRDGRWRVETRD